MALGANMSVVLAFQNKAIRNRKEHHEMDRHVVLAFQIKAIRNHTGVGQNILAVVLAFQIKAIRNISAKILPIW